MQGELSLLPRLTGRLATWRASSWTLSTLIFIFPYFSKGIICSFPFRASKSSDIDHEIDQQGGKAQTPQGFILFLRAQEKASFPTTRRPGITVCREQRAIIYTYQTDMYCMQGNQTFSWNKLLPRCIRAAHSNSQLPQGQIGGTQQQTKIWIKQVKSFEHQSLPGSTSFDRKIHIWIFNKDPFFTPLNHFLLSLSVHSAVITWPQLAIEKFLCFNLLRWSECCVHTVIAIEYKPINLAFTM